MNLEEKLESLTPRSLLKWLAWILGVATGLFGLVLTLYLMEFNNGFSNENSDWGTFGDFVGGTLNPIFGFLSLIALLLTIVLQSKELESTRIELERSASAQEKTEAALNKQSDTQEKQQFENTFFSLLDQHNKALEKISTPTGKYTKGRSVLDIVRLSVFSGNHANLQDAKNALEKHNDICGHYFRVLYQVLKFIATNVPDGSVGSEFSQETIADSKLAPSEKMYSNIVRSFLSYDATQLLAINCYCADRLDTYWNFKLLIERYSFLEHMPFKFKEKDHVLLVSTKEFYEKNAFGRTQFKTSSQKA
ncbi:putative phage abortive infection protein [Pseudomonas chlororaphis]|uniref:putative phage abortive infection protein n=1 Tax=Pseudomonas chlororaphis TaxID=587753 RepID=UPI001CF5844C|nr:putative phage abortive infection protein [Pseudomonas chlororaphis]UCR83775.1 putative phage abortive infection protein [Pseudomonas chlororaphis]